MSVDPTTGVVVWTPTADQQFPQPVLLQVVDGQGGIDLQPYTVLVAPEFQPPSITSDPLLITTVDEPYLYDAGAFDPENDPLIFSLVSAPAGMTIDPGTGLLSWTPTVTDLGPNQIQEKTHLTRLRTDLVASQKRIRRLHRGKATDECTRLWTIIQRTTPMAALRLKRKGTRWKSAVTAQRRLPIAGLEKLNLHNGSCRL